MQNRFKFVVSLVIGLLVVEIIIHSLWQPSAVSAQAGIQYGYLQPQAGDATSSGGKQFIDMRNGNSWICDFRGCSLGGHFPFENIK